MNYKSIFILFFLILFSCTSHEFQKFKPKNLKVERIERSKDEVYSPVETPKKNDELLYPFEEDNLSFLKITKDFFRCKGNPLNPQRNDETTLSDAKVFVDCEGSSRHGLPMINSKEGVYPILLDLLNYIQKKVNKRVVITCGYRCPKHNSYADILNNSKFSMHMLGAEVDFYVQGYEQNPDKIVEIIEDFYKENVKYRGKEEFEKFNRYEKPLDVSTQPWYNKEIFIKLYQSNEGRDFDNRHPYPYLSIQVLWDRTTKEVVSFSLDKANKGYLRW